MNLSQKTQKSEQLISRSKNTKSEFEAGNDAAIPINQAYSKPIDRPKFKAHSFVYGAFILGVCSFLAKLMGAVFRIPLTYILGAEGMGLYQMVFPLYALLLTISSGGLPSALSRIIAEKTAKGEHRTAQKVLATALISLTVFGAVCTVVIVLFHRLIAYGQGNVNAAISYLGIAPSIVFVAVISAFRGYFQGRQNMFPSALSQIIEQFVKMAAGLSLTYTLKGYGLNYAVFGAVIGVTLSELAAMALIIFQYYHDKTRLKLEYPKREVRRYIKLIYAISIPMTISSIIMPVTQLIDSILVINILSGFYPVNVSTTLFGLFSGTVSSLVNMPVVLLLSISVALIPSIVSSRAKGHNLMVEKKSSLALKLTVLLALPCFVGLFIYAQPIINFLYGRGLKIGEVNEPAVAAKLLSIYSVSVIFVSILSVSSSVLQSLGYNYVPVKNLGIGAIIKIVLNFVLLRFVGIYGAAISSAVCYMVAMTLNLISLKKRVKIKYDIIGLVLKPVIASGLMGICAYYTYSLCNNFVDYRLSLIAAVILSVAVYFGLIAAMGVLNEEEMASIPLIKKLIKVQKPVV